METNNIFLILIFCIFSLLVINLLKNTIGIYISQFLSLIIIVCCIYYIYKYLLNNDSLEPSKSNDSHSEPLQNETKENETKENETKENETKENETEEIETKENETKENYENYDTQEEEDVEKTEYEFSNKELFTNKNFLDSKYHVSTNTIGDNVKDTFLDIRRMPSNIRKTTNVFEHFERKNIC